jgi:hypothetical protein
VPDGPMALIIRPTSATTPTRLKLQPKPKPPSPGSESPSQLLSSHVESESTCASRCQGLVASDEMRHLLPIVPAGHTSISSFHRESSDVQ